MVWAKPRLTVGALPFPATFSQPPILLSIGFFVWPVVLDKMFGFFFPFSLGSFYPCTGDSDIPPPLKRAVGSLEALSTRQLNTPSATKAHRV